MLLLAKKLGRRYSFVNIVFKSDSQVLVSRLLKLLFFILIFDSFFRGYFVV